jgi:hypothetical protein
MFCSETWLQNNDKALELINANGYTTSSQSSMSYDYLSGRPHGGLLWIFNNKYADMIKIQYHSKNISSLTMSKLIIVGVYMSCNDDFKQDIELLDQTIISLSDHQNQIICIGDFNASLSRYKLDQNLSVKRFKYPNDKYLDFWLNREKTYGIIDVSQLYHQLADCTFSNGLTSSFIDHVYLIGSEDKWWNLINVELIISSYQYESLRKKLSSPGDYNTKLSVFKHTMNNLTIEDNSDHKPFRVELEINIPIETNNDKTLTEPEVRKKRINWIDDNDRSAYLEYLIYNEDSLKNKCRSLWNITLGNAEDTINNAMFELKHALKSAIESTIKNNHIETITD